MSFSSAQSHQFQWHVFRVYCCVSSNLKNFEVLPVVSRRRPKVSSFVRFPSQQVLTAVPKNHWSYPTINSFKPQGIWSPGEFLRQQSSLSCRISTTRCIALAIVGFSFSHRWHSPQLMFMLRSQGQDQLNEQLQQHGFPLPHRTLDLACPQQ